MAGIWTRGAAALVACALAAPAAAQRQASDTLVVARNMDVNSLDPHRAFCDTCQIYLSAAYETLVTLAAARLRDAPEPLHRLGEDRPAGSLHGGRGQCVTRGAVARRHPPR